MRYYSWLRVFTTLDFPCITDEQFAGVPQSTVVESLTYSQISPAWYPNTNTRFDT
jgi:hypothetical protein